MPVDPNGAAYAAAQMLGGNIPGIGPNPMGAFYAAQLMGQNQVQAPQVQDAQNTANQFAQEQLKQAQIQTPLMQATSSLGIQQANQQQQVGQQYGVEELTKATEAKIHKAVADMSGSDLNDFNNKLSKVDMATSVAEGMGTIPGQKEQSLEERRDRAWKFISKSKDAQEHINQMLPEGFKVDFSSPNANAQLWGDGDAAFNTREQRHALEMQRLKGSQEMDVQQSRNVGSANVATIQANALKNTEGVITQIEQKAQQVGWSGLSPVELQQYIDNKKNLIDKDLSSDKMVDMEKMAIVGEKDPAKRAKLQDAFEAKHYGPAYTAARDALRAKEGGMNKAPTDLKANSFGPTTTVKLKSGETVTGRYVLDKDGKPISFQKQ